MYLCFTILHTRAYPVHTDQMQTCVWVTMLHICSHINIQSAVFFGQSTKLMKRCNIWYKALRQGGGLLQHV